MKSVNIYNYMPVIDDEMMDRYLREDNEFEERKELLYKVLLMAAGAEKKKFGHAVISAVFDDNYIKTHRWPTVK